MPLRVRAGAELAKLVGVEIMGKVSARGWWAAWKTLVHKVPRDKNHNDTRTDL